MSDYFSKQGPTGGADSFKQAHKNSDVDESRDALHHTLGTRPTQAAAGNHGHTNLVKSFGETIGWSPNVRNSDNSALAHVLNYALHRNVDGVVTWALSVTVAANGLNFVMFNLPVPTSAGLSYAVGHGRENAIIGATLQAFLTGTQEVKVFTYNNGNTAVLNYVLVLSGSYITDVA